MDNDEPSESEAHPATKSGDAEVVREARRWKKIATLSALIAAASVLGTIVSTLALGRHNGELSELRKREADGSIFQASRNADDNPANRHLSLISTDGSKRVDAVVGDSGDGFLTDFLVGDVPSGKSLQLWAVAGASKTSIGVIGSPPKVFAFRLPEATSAVEVTLEDAKGSVSQSAPPIAAATLP